MPEAQKESHAQSISQVAGNEPVYRGKPEDILVVSRDVLQKHNLVQQGFTQVSSGANVQEIERVIRTSGQFHPRALMETDPNYKQIIPYFVFAHQEHLFLMQRSGSANETRLASKYTLGIGGHVRNQDLLEGDIAAWGKREFEEEVNYSGSLTVSPLGILNDDSDDVGKVHIGVVYLLHGDSSDISIRSELQSGRLASIDECDTVYDRMEGWSALVFDALKKARYI